MGCLYRELLMTADLSLIDYDRTLVPPEDTLDPYHPANDSYIQKLQATQRSILAHTRHMRPRHVNAIKRIHAGEPHVSIAKSLNIQPATVSNIKRSPAGRRLLALLSHYAHAVDGPNQAQRRNLLWRIAVDNEATKPQTAIQAVSEINRMTMAEYDKNVCSR